MVLEVETGTAVKDSTGTDGATQDVTVGFDPKGLIIFGTKNKTSEGDARATNCASIGFCDDADNNRTIGCQNEDNVGSSDCRKTQRDDAVLVFLTDSTATVESQASCTLETAKFTLTWDTNDTNATLLHWMAFGGSDITGTQVGTFNKTTASAPVVQSVTLDADCQNASDDNAVLFTIHDGVAGFNSVANNEQMEIGMATSPSREGSIFNGSDDNTTSMETYNGYRNNFVIVSHNSVNGTTEYTGEFSAWDSLGFDINWTLNSANADRISFLVIKGGKWEVDNDTVKITSTGTKAYTTGFQPKGLFTLGTNRTTTGVSRVDTGMYVGAASSTTTETSMAYQGDNFSDPMEVGIGSSNTHVVRVINPVTQAIFNEAILNSFNATDFTLDHTTVNGSAFLFVSLVCGDADIIGFAHSQGIIIG